MQPDMIVHHADYVSSKDTLLAQLKKRAADMGASVSTLIEQAVRLMMQSSLRGKSKKPFKLVTYDIF